MKKTARQIANEVLNKVAQNLSVTDPQEEAKKQIATAPKVKLLTMGQNDPGGTYKGKIDGARIYDSGRTWGLPPEKMEGLVGGLSTKGQRPKQVTPGTQQQSDDRMVANVNKQHGQYEQSRGVKQTPALTVNKRPAAGAAPAPAPAPAAGAAPAPAPAPAAVARRERRR